MIEIGCPRGAILLRFFLELEQTGVLQVGWAQFLCLRVYTGQYGAQTGTETFPLRAALTGERM